MGTALLALPLLFSLQACDDSGGGDATAPVSFGVSDTPVTGLSSVVITIDRIVLNRPGHADVVIDRFTSDALDVVDEDTITIDLLDYRGEDNLLIVGPVEIDVAEYQNLRLDIIDNDITRTFVEELDGDIRPLRVPSNQLRLGRFEVENSGDQTFILEFGLRKAMTYNPTPDRYILKPRGVRIVELARGATVGGAIDTALFNDAPPCDEKMDPVEDNVMYIYRGLGLDPSAFADNFDPALQPNAADLLEPYAAETVAADGTYLFSYLPAGDYTLAFSCEAGADDPDLDDGIMIPSPQNVLIEVSPGPGEDWACDFGLPVDMCERIAP
jgi:hypothetical protein